tara:strand:+ start:81 stop:500 length:420 start_codon:yes stop_codon:yes gene_type:complete
LNNKNSDKDKKDWEDFLSNEEDLFDKDEVLQKNKVKRVRTFDFHGYSLDQANKKIKDLIYDSYNQGVGKLIIVTGKGLHSKNEKNPYISKDLSILKYSLPEFIKNDPELMNLIYDIKDARSEDGGSGAFYIFLKKKFIK